MTKQSKSRPRRTERRKYKSIHRPLGKLRTIPETAQILQLSPRTVQRLIERKELRAHYIGPLVRIEDADIAALLDSTESI